MTLKVPNASEQTMLENILNITAPQELVLRLFTNDKVPADGDTAADYTEAAGNGYAAININHASWVITPGNPTVAVYPQQTFTFTGALGNVYGYYLAEAVSGKLKWAERFTDGPYNIVNNGDQIKVTPRFTLG